jgi:hypothetical protein
VPGPIDSSESHDSSRRRTKPPSPVRPRYVTWSRAKHHEPGVKRAARHFRQFQLKDVTGWGAVRCHDHTPQLVGVRSRQMLRSAECARPIRPVTQRSAAEGLPEQPRVRCWPDLEIDEDQESWVARLWKKDACAEPLGLEYFEQWPRGTRSPESELVARPVPKPERRSVGVIFFLPSRWHLFDVGPTSRPLSAPINQLHPVIGTWGRESRLPLQLSRSPFGC